MLLPFYCMNTTNPFYGFPIYCKVFHVHFAQYILEAQVLCQYCPCTVPGFHIHRQQSALTHPTGFSLTAEQ